jgi:hypothetical protein
MSGKTKTNHNNNCDARKDIVVENAVIIPRPKTATNIVTA